MPMAGTSLYYFSDSSWPRSKKSLMYCATTIDWAALSDMFSLAFAGDQVVHQKGGPGL
jgi:hypothetical protein